MLATAVGLGLFASSGDDRRASRDRGRDMGRDRDKVRWCAAADDWVVEWFGACHWALTWAGKLELAPLLGPLAAGNGSQQARTQEAFTTPDRR